MGDPERTSSQQGETGVSVRQQRFLDRYGELMTSDEVADVLRYSSGAAVRQAHAAGRLPVRLVRFRPRRTLFTFSLEVAAAIDALDDQFSR
jgi:hypothetical protein